MFLQLCLSLLERHMRIYNCQHAFSIAESDSCNLRQQNRESGDAHASGFLHFLRHQTHAFNTTALLQKSLSTRLQASTQPFFPPSFWNMNLSWKLIHFWLCSKWSCLYIPVEAGILSHLSWMVSSRITAAECDTELHRPSLLRKTLERAVLFSGAGVPD